MNDGGIIQPDYNAAGIAILHFGNQQIRARILQRRRHRDVLISMAW